MAETLNQEEMQALGQSAWQKQLTAVKFAPKTTGKLFVTPAKAVDLVKADAILTKFQTAEDIKEVKK